MWYFLFNFFFSLYNSACPLPFPSTDDDEMIVLVAAAAAAVVAIAAGDSWCVLWFFTDW